MAGTPKSTTPSRTPWGYNITSHSDGHGPDPSAVHKPRQHMLHRDTSSIAINTRRPGANRQVGRISAGLESSPNPQGMEHLVRPPARNKHLDRRTGRPTRTLGTPSGTGPTYGTHIKHHQYHTLHMCNARPPINTKASNSHRFAHTTPATGWRPTYPTFGPLGGTVPRSCAGQELPGLPMPLQRPTLLR